MGEDASVMTSEQKNPYIGPRPFKTGEKTRFFGRDREADLLIPLILSERLVLFYAQSGAGKSSLLNAKIIPGLQNRNFITLSGRVSGSELTKNEVDNIFIYNLLVSLDPEKSKTTDLGHTTLEQYLADLDVNAYPAPDPNRKDIPLDAPPIINGVQPLVLIIDQFEEIFNTHPEAYDHRAPFFDQLCLAMQKDPYLWVVLTIREDYVAQLDPYANQLPGRMRARFYMQRMKKDAALEAVAKPVKDDSPFTDDAAKELVKSLSMIAVGRDENKVPIYQEGEFVEPVQLQVVCYQLWENLKPQKGSRITLENIQQAAGDKDLTGFIVRALREFYEGVLQNVIEETRKQERPVSERVLREWFSTALITEDRTRSSIFRGDTYTGTLPNFVVDLLERRFIIRGEMRAGGRWYELVHDRLIQPIRSSNQEWLAANTTKLEKDALAWKENHDAGRLYDGRQLKEALALQKKGELTPLENEFIRESQEEAERKKAAARRNRRLLVVSAIAALLFLFVSVFAFGAMLVAADSENAAETARADALDKKSIAEVAGTQAAFQRDEAQKAYATAEVAKNIALTQEANARDALKARDQADQKTLISRLAAYAKYYVLESRDLSLLFAVAAWKQGADTWEAREALGSSVWSAYNNQPYDILVSDYAQFLSPDSGVFSLDISNEGSLLATGGGDGLVNLWDLNTKSQVQVPTSLQSSYRVYAIQFSPDGRYLALGGGEGQVKIWDRQNDKVLPAYRPDGKEALIHALAFDRESRYLAIALGDGRLMLYSIEEQKKVKELFEPSGDIWSVAWSPVANRVAYGGKSGVIRVYSLESQKEEKVLANVLNNPVQGLVWSPDGRYLYAGSQDRVLMRWDVDAAGYQVLRSRKEDTEKIISLDLNKDGTVLVSGNENHENSVTLWDAKTLRPIGSPRANNSWVRAVSFDPQGSYFATGGDDYRAYVLQVQSLDPLGRLIGSVPGGGILALGHDPQEGLVALKTVGAGASEAVQLYSANTLQPLGSSYAALYDNYALQLVQRNNRLELALGQTGKVIFTDPRTGQPLEDDPPIPLADMPVSALGFRPDGNVLGAALCSVTNPDDPNLPCIESRVVFWDLETRKEIQELKVAQDVTSLGISPNGQAVLGRADGYLSFYDLASGNKLHSDDQDPWVNNDHVIRADYSPDGKLLFTSTPLGDLQIWDPAERRLIYMIYGDYEVKDPVLGVLFGYDENKRLRMYAGSWLGNIHDWDMDPGSWAGRACNLVSTSVNENEIWTQNFPNTVKNFQICAKP